MADDTSLRPRPGETPEQTLERVIGAVRKVADQEEERQELKFEVQVHSPEGPDLSYEAETLGEAVDLAHNESGPGDRVVIIDHEFGRVVEEFDVPERKRLIPCRREEDEGSVTEGPTGIAGFRSGRYR